MILARAVLVRNSSSVTGVLPDKRAPGVPGPSYAETLGSWQHEPFYCLHELQSAAELASW